MITTALELQFWYTMFNTTFHQEPGLKGTFHTVWHEDEKLFREACFYHISRLTLPLNNVKYTLCGITYQAGEKAPKNFTS